MEIENEILRHHSGQPEAGRRIFVPAEVYPYRAGFGGGIVAGVVMALVMAAKVFETLQVCPLGERGYAAKRLSKRRRLFQ